MKTHPLSAPGSPMRLFVRRFALILGVALFVFAASSIRAQGIQLDIGVRSTLMDKPFGKSNPQDWPQHGKVYGILSVQLIPEAGKLVRPVDAHWLLGLVRHELDTHGFRQVVKPAHPDILITVQYGRAWLFNPYDGEDQTVVSGMGTDGGESRTRTIVGSTAGLMRQMEHGVEAKKQKANYEKLCIKVTAWQYPTDPKMKARQLWHTIVNVDDPEHRDLNAIAEEMLATGAPYFDKEIKEEEIDVFKPMPDGHVSVGTPEVVDPARTK